MAVVDTVVAVAVVVECVILLLSSVVTRLSISVESFVAFATPPVTAKQSDDDLAVLC